MPTTDNKKRHFLPIALAFWVNSQLIFGDGQWTRSRTSWSICKDYPKLPTSVRCPWVNWSTCQPLRPFKYDLLYSQFDESMKARQCQQWAVKQSLGSSSCSPAHLKIHNLWIFNCLEAVKFPTPCPIKARYLVRSTFLTLGHGMVHWNLLII